MQIKFASYNIHKAVGLDRRRDHERILRILLEIDADVVALQEVDRRFGRRMAVLPLDAIHAATDYVPVPLSMKPDSLGWHGNALLVRKGIDLIEAAPVPLPVLEPRGAIRADLAVEGRRIRTIGMHLDLSGLRRRHQVRSVLAHCGDCDDHVPTVMMGDLNEWSQHGGCLREFDHRTWQVLAPGRSFPSRRPIARLDRIIVSSEWQVLGTNVHHSPLSAIGSDHLPAFATLKLPKK
ncbi:endonuclease/exonuclease/phosphatase family protein [Novosphingobium mangrovi (ex Huang et al. 2023)]|uniref:Endonuclease/exonuclease/phosphatase family protein n=1 Tax=Novosphingobium mangrovi (ex Huang et al. 2023) TaxID=2976432 RepID=A0ABT2I300_9SPHN|nr:endonuclease/exonuclease/phosphatase family protein [Novosphingobium mangrovi (ex Huang et al. 2023)]MCT2399182.1 endonuclease/exonuclease/phosphatase family protein [Novosphingobium mangrovi (ex Huang et al. 2023)]